MKRGSASRGEAKQESLCNSFFARFAVDSAVQTALQKKSERRARKEVNPYYNLPPEQRETQRFVDKFNADERLWKKLAPDIWSASRRPVTERFTGAPLPWRTF